MRELGSHLLHLYLHMCWLLPGVTLGLCLRHRTQARTYAETRAAALGWPTPVYLAVAAVRYSVLWPVTVALLIRDDIRERR